MKKLFAIIIMISTITAGSFSIASAADFLLGARAGYFVWEPWLKDFAPLFENIDTGSGVLYGPVASILFTEDLSLSFSGLFGSQHGSGITEGLYSQDKNNYQDLKYSFKVFRMDIDAALSYRLTEHFKIFAGYKFWYLKTKYSSIDIRYSASSPYALEEANKESGTTFIQPFHGPAAGIGFSLPVGTRGYFIATNISGLYMLGKLEMESGDSYHYSTTITTEAGSEQNFDMKMYGVNVEFTTGFNPGEGYPIITIGVRYQYNRMKLVDQMDEDAGASTDWMTDTIYGLFVGALYHI